MSTESCPEPLSGLAYIDVKTSDPIVLFKEWHQEAKKFIVGIPNVVCLATTSKDGHVSARNVILRRQDDDGFVFITNANSRKTRDLREVPSAAMCFLWAYKNDVKTKIERQVRVEGSMIELEKKDYQSMYDSLPVYCKIRSYITEKQGEVDWNQLKVDHDKLLAEVRDRGEIVVPMPESVIAYKMLPSMMEFYHAHGTYIADRVVFRKDTDSGKWNHCHEAT